MKLSKKKRLEIYWDLYFLFEGLHKVKREWLMESGFCFYIRKFTDWQKEITEFPELMKFMPEKFSSPGDDYWWPLTNKGFKRRQEVLLECIKSLETAES